jgi:diguanylate cyclase (GGDEF)-like protein/PAS domain S-box-containing protein
VTRRGSLLVVDDNELNRDALSRRLRKAGYDVTVAVDGQEAIALGDAGRFDLVLLDVEMPGMSGLEVLAHLRRTRVQTVLPIIMVTARTQGTDIVEAFRLGANDYVTKPIDFPVALARIGTHLSHKWAVEDLRESEERYALAIQGANDGLWDWNLTTDEVHWSARWKALLGCGDVEIGSSPEEWFSRVHHDDLAGVQKALNAHLASGSGHYESEHRVLHGDGTFRWVLCRGAAVRNAAGVATRLAGSLTDITEAKVADPLTGLPNRLLFVDLLDRALKRSRRRPEYLFALLVLGLDRFKAVNNSLGLLTADQLLIAVSRRLQACLRSTDAIMHGEQTFTLARLAGDEFTILLDEIADASDAIRVAERLRAALQTPFDVAGQQVYTSASVGIAVSATGYEKPEDILRDASIALHRAKGEGTPRCEVFDVEMRERAISRLQIETDLRYALERELFEVHYQPIVSLGGGFIAGFEALVRWRHPLRGLVSPAEFIAVAEDTGMILQIGRLMLARSCQQMVEWQARFGSSAPSVVCVNVSSRQFADIHLARHIERILEETGLAPASLKLEITESAFLGDIQTAQATLDEVQSMGIEWSLDDFGTGYSSLSHLHRLKVDTVKVDRSFVSRMGVDDGGVEMVRAIVALAHSLGMDVVAEGVETRDQLARLQALDCEYAQGFYFSRPVDAAAAGLLIAAQPWTALLAPAMAAGRAGS